CREERRFHAHVGGHGRVPRVLEMREAEWLAPGRAAPRAHPDRSLLLAHRTGRDDSALAVLVGDKARHEAARTVPTVAPAVVRALEDSVDDPPPRQRQVAMGAAVEEGGRPALRVTEEDERLVEDHAGERPPAEIGR